MNLIKAVNIQKSFKNTWRTSHILNGIDVEIKENEFVAIMGKSGAGKSTLLYQLSALDTPTSGDIFISEVNILKLNKIELTNFRLNTLGYIFQDYALIPDLNAHENVLLPLLMRGLDWKKAVSLADTALNEVGLIDKFDNMPSQLSGGEQQRVSVARAIAGRPKILFADEPTANLDSKSGASIISLLNKLHQEGQTVVMVTHEREHALGAHRILHMEDGLMVREERLREL